MNPLRPALSTSCRFMPKPRATTEACNKNLARARLSDAYGCSVASPKMIPAQRAMGGEIKPVALRISRRKKAVFVFIQKEELVYDELVCAIEARDRVLRKRSGGKGCPELWQAPPETCRRFRAVQAARTRNRDAAAAVSAPSRV